VIDRLFDALDALLVSPEYVAVNEKRPLPLPAGTLNADVVQLALPLTSGTLAQSTAKNRVRFDYSARI